MFTLNNIFQYNLKFISILSVYGFNCSGQQVLVKKVIVNNGTNFNTIDVSVLKSGVYTLKINNGKEIQTKKMIISK